MPLMPMMPRRRSHSSKCRVARWLDGPVTGASTTSPTALLAEEAMTDSTSSSLAPTLPMWGKVKVTIWPA